MRYNQFIKIIKKYIKGNSSKEETKLVDFWYNNVGREDENVLAETRRAEVESRLLAAINRSINAQQNRIKFINVKWIAATVLFSLSLSILLYLNRSHKLLDIVFSKSDSYAALISNKSITEIKQIILPDSSIVALHPGGQLYYTILPTDTVRVVKLVGEAFFSVSHNPRRPFMVLTEKLTTKVLGTSFRVKADKSNKSVTISVMSGKVSVSKSGIGNQKDYLLLLTPNEKIVYDIPSDQLIHTLIDQPQIVIAKEELRLMHFENTPLKKIFEAIESIYNVKIVFDHAALEGCNLTTTMTNENLYKRLNIICRAINASYKLEGTRIIIESNGCN